MKQSEPGSHILHAVQVDIYSYKLLGRKSIKEQQDARRAIACIR